MPNPSLRIIPLAREINDGMPGHMLALVEDALAEAGRALAGSRVVLLGASYLENADDTRNTPAAALARLLLARGAEVIAHDPHVRHADWKRALDGVEVPLLHDLGEALRGADCAALVTAHREYLALDPAWVAATMRTAAVVDGRNALDGAAWQDAGVAFRGLGKAAPLGSPQAPPGKEADRGLQG